MSVDPLFQALSAFAERCAATSDARVHQNAAKQFDGLVVISGDDVALLEMYKKFGAPD